MKIGFIGNITPPVGGAEVLLNRFLTGFGARRHSSCLVRWRRQVFIYFPERVVRVYAPRGTVLRRGNLSVHYLFETIERDRYERRADFGQRIKEQYKQQGLVAARIFERSGSELIHAHMLFPNLFFGATAAKALGLPFVATIHGMLEFRILEFFRKKYPGFAKLVDQAFRQADVVVAVSDEIAQECRRRGARRVVMISGGVDAQTFRPEKKRSRQPQDIVFVGSVRQDKGASILIQAFERLNGQLPGNLVFAGKRLIQGPVYERAKRNRKIRFLGVQKASEIRKVIHQARMVVLPSASEGLPISMLEAMACETPVLVTRTGQVPKLIRNKKNGFLIDQRTPKGLAQQIQEVASRTDLKQIGRRARKTALEFDIRSVVRQYESLYHGLLS